MLCAHTLNLPPPALEGALPHRDELHVPVSVIGTDRDAARATDVEAAAPAGRELVAVLRGTARVAAASARGVVAAATAAPEPAGGGPAGLRGVADAARAAVQEGSPTCGLNVTAAAITAEAAPAAALGKP